MSGFAVTELRPVNGGNVEFEVKRYDNYIFKRTVLKTALVLTGNDYNLFKRIETSGHQCDECEIIIERKCGGVWGEYWRGIFSYSYCNVNNDDCVIEFTPDVNDAYTCLLNKGALEHNILDITNIITTYSTNVLQFEYTTCQQTMTVCAIPGNPCTDSIYCDAVQSGGGSLFNVAYGCLESYPLDYQLYSTRIDNYVGVGMVGDVTTVWFREVRLTLDVGGLPSPPSGSGWTNRGDVMIGSRHGHRWTRQPYGGAYTAQAHYPGLWQHVTGNVCSQIFQWQDPNPTTITYDRGRLLSDVLSRLVGLSGCIGSSSIVSDILRINTTLLPSDMDYVTGLPTLINQLVINAKSDIKTPSSSEAANTANLSFLQLMDMLRKELNIWWLIDGGTLRIEHLSYFQNMPMALDLTATEYTKYMLRTNKYSYRREDLPRIERFENAEQGGIDFIGMDITYESLCVNNTEDGGMVITRVDVLTTDIGYIQTDQTAISDSGFVLMATYIDNSGDRWIVNGLGALTGLNAINVPLSWANLHRDYHTWGRVLPNGIMNGSYTGFDSWVKTKKQVQLSVPMCCTVINFAGLVKTGLGVGEVDSASYNSQTGMIKLSLMY